MSTKRIESQAFANCLSSQSGEVLDRLVDVGGQYPRHKSSDRTVEHTAADVRTQVEVASVDHRGHRHRQSNVDRAAAVTGQGDHFGFVVFGDGPMDDIPEPLDLYQRCHLGSPRRSTPEPVPSAFRRSSSIRRISPDPTPTATRLAVGVLNRSRRLFPASSMSLSPRSRTVRHLFWTSFPSERGCSGTDPHSGRIHDMVGGADRTVDQGSASAAAHRD